MPRYVDVDALLKQIEIDSKGIEGSYGDKWQFMDTIKSMPIVTINDHPDEIKVINCHHIADVSKKDDMISRADVCEILSDMYPTDGEKVVRTKCIDTAYDAVLRLPTVQPNVHDFPKDADCISRQAAIDALDRIFDRCEEIEAHLPEGDPDRTGYKMYPDYMTVWKYLRQLPSAQPEHGTNLAEVGRDCISRQAAIDALDCINGTEEVLRSLPSVQSEIIRCKDCRWKYGAECVRFAEIRPFPDDFCSRAERRANDCI